MIRDAWQVFTKDGRELLRDRRTIFVNVVLPVLLYPILGLFAIQVMQLMRADPADQPQVALLEVDPTLRSELAEHALTPASQEANAGESEDRADAAPGSATDGQIGYRLRELDTATAATLSPLLRELAAADERVEESEDEGEAAKARAQEAAAAARAELRAAMRRLDLTALISEWPAESEPADTDDLPPRRLVVAYDQAHRYFTQLSAELEARIAAYEEAEIQERLAERALPAQLAEPISVTRLSTAETSEALRVRIAGIIPLLLVFMALSGAFIPALDLIAGERERGTLETLLAWPGDRRAIFLGKLWVVIAAALVSVVLNLASLGLTVGILAGQMAGAAAGGATLEGLSLGAGMLALCALALLPVAVTLAAISLAIAGFAASYKEAQNYLSPLIIAVVAPATMVTMIPTAKPSILFDLVPVVGPLLALKESLQSTDSIPWGHLLLSLVASSTVAAVVVAWSVRLLDHERFLYPGLVRAGWGRFRRWGRGPDAPGGLEALGLFAVAIAGFVLTSGLVRGVHPALQIVLPLAIGVGAPALLLLYLGAYPARSAAFWRPPPRRAWGLALAIAPLAVLMTLAIGQLQTLVLGEPPAMPGLDEAFADLLDEGGVVLLVACIALAPGIFEELLFRGPILSGLRRGVGPVGAILVSAFLFAALHASPWRLFPQFAVGVVLAMLVLRSGSLWPAILVHVLHNGILATFATLPVQESWFRQPPMVTVPLLLLVGLIIALLLRCLPAAETPAEHASLS